MELVTCPECGREKVSMMAAACPGCGFPIAEHFKDQAATEQRAEDLCRQFLLDIGSEIAECFQFSPKLKKGLQIPDDVEVYLAHDDTMFSSGKNGFAITDKGIYCKVQSDPIVYTSFEELGKIKKLDWDDPKSHSVILGDGKPLVYYTDGEEEAEEGMVRLLSELVKLFSGGRELAADGASSADAETSRGTAPEAAPAAEDPAAETQTAEEPVPAVSAAEVASDSRIASSEGQNMGYNSVENTQGFTDEQLLEKLTAVKVSFGTPIMGDMNGTPAVMYKNVTDHFDIFCRVNGKNVIMGKIGSDADSSVQTAAIEGLGTFFGYSDESTTKANRAVDELCGVVRQLERGEEVTESAASAMGEGICLYMAQKALSLKPKFDIYDQDRNPVYHIEGDVARLSFSIQKNGTEVLKLKKKPVAFLMEYRVEKNDTEIARVKKKFKLTNPELSGQVNGKELHINGNLFGYDYDIEIGGVIIGHVDTDYGYWSDHYRIRCYDPEIQDVLVALAVICDHVADKEEAKDN